MRDTRADVAERRSEPTLWGLFNEREWDAWWSLLGENVEWHARTDKPDVDIYHGHSELERFKDAWMEMFPDIRVELTGESIDLGEQVITPSASSGRRGRPASR